jgi:hypothetical protein
MPSAKESSKPKAKVPGFAARESEPLFILMGNLAHFAAINLPLNGDKGPFLKAKVGVRPAKKIGHLANLRRQPNSLS